jgi:ribosomal protein S18 acetylase RimI-like enzyme
MTQSPLARYRTGGRRVTYDGMIELVSTGDSGPGNNWVSVVGDAPAERVFTLAQRFFGGTPHSVEVASELAPSVEAVAQADGWKLDEEEPALVLPALPEPLPAAPSDLDIRLVTDAAGRSDFFSVAHVPPAYIPPAAITDPGVALFVGYRDGQPAATSRLVCMGRIADITSVVTRPEQRRRGYGTAMTWAAAAAGFSRGCTVAFLTATEMGYPVYLKMGFIRICTMRVYLPPDASGAGAGA